MAHIRKLIRDNIEATLTGLATTNGRVYKTRVYPVAEDRLPGLAIYTRDESTEYATITKPRTQMRELTVSVEIYVKAQVDYDDELDQIASEIEAALYTDITRGGYAKDTMVTGFDCDFSGEGDQPVARGTMQISVDYVTLEGNPEVAQ